MNETAFLFVYGTLRQGSGHAMAMRLREQASYRGPAWMDGAALYRVSWYPGLVMEAGRVRGDLYCLESPARLLAELDAFEELRGQPDDEYERRLSRIVLENGEQLAAWVYWYRLPVTELEKIHSEDWLQQ